MPTRMLRVFRSCARSAFAIAVLVSGLAGQALAQNANPGVAPPHSTAFGHTYGGWSAEWWQWYLSIPTDTPHPAIGGDCGVGQSGRVFNLAADFTGSPELSCTIPTGKAVLFAMANIECSTVEGPPFFGANEEELRNCAACWADLIDVSSLQATLDGRELVELGAYRASSPLFSFEYPADNIFGIPNGPGTGQSVSDGYWVLLNPLSRGDHTLSFSGEFQIPEGGACGLPDGGFSFGFGATYRLSVTGGPAAGRR
jgi:hypothetical protein